jgi:hypothetical protein
MVLLGILLLFGLMLTSCITTGGYGYGYYGYDPGYYGSPHGYGYNHYDYRYHYRDWDDHHHRR